MTSLYPAKERRRQALQRQVSRLERQITRLGQQNNRFTWLRLLTFLAGFILSGSLFFLRGPRWWLPAVALWLLLFGAAVAVHRRHELGLRRFQLWREIKLAQLARMDLDWAALAPPVAPANLPSEHPFAFDLDLTGAHSLFHLLDVGVSQGGSHRLLAWLLDATPETTAIRRRQELVRELAPRSHLRDRLRLRALLARPDYDDPEPAARLQNWLAHAEAPGFIRPLLLVLSVLAAANALLFLANTAGQLAPWWQLSLAFYAAVYLLLGRPAGAVFGEALSLQAALQQAAAVFDYLERLSLPPGSALASLCKPFRQPDRPSIYLRRVNRIVNAAGLAANPVLAVVLNAIFPWNLFLAFRLYHWRQELATRLPGWLDVWYELEALSSLANLAYLNPHYSFPVLDGETTPPFAGRQLGHPLLPDTVKVRNDFTIPAIGHIDIVTGSNMAGKSSFLRTLGINLVLAYAGGPVDADKLHARFFRLFTSMRITDSVTDGISYFYAEVLRLKALLDALHGPDPRPLFFLIDEIFRGTNNRERLLGSMAYVEALSGGHGVGVIATHDLELVQLAATLPQVRNYHFRDTVRGKRMVFDYELRPGPSPTTNALKIMHRAGLPVPEEAPSDQQRN